MGELTTTKLWKSPTQSISQNIKDQAKRELHHRKRNVLHLIMGYLKDNNLQETAAALEQEAQIDEHFEVCDNIDLDIILQEYSSYYYAKFQRYPKFVRQVNKDVSSPNTRRQSGPKKPKKKLEKGESSHSSDSSPLQDRLNFGICVTSLNSQVENKVSTLYDEENITHKPLCDFDGYTPEWREMANQILKELVPKNLGTTWDDCIGLDEQAELLKEATIYPLKFPDVFKGLCSSWKGVLLYGPPGTGKTLLAKALACEGSTTFINVTSSAFVSKWRGESEKMIKVLFDVAKYYSPTTIFIDEVDSLTSASSPSNHEASIRFKSELLIQIDGILNSDHLVFILASTNAPWKLDLALLRRLEKRILVPLPNNQMKIRIFQHYLQLDGRKNIKSSEIESIMNMTENFSGSDIKIVCKEASMKVIRELLKQIKVEKHRKVTGRDLTMADLIDAIKTVKSCVTNDEYHKYIEWNKKFGSR